MELVYPDYAGGRRERQRGVRGEQAACGAADARSCGRYQIAARLDRWRGSGAEVMANVDLVARLEAQVAADRDDAAPLTMDADRAVGGQCRVAGRLHRSAINTEEDAACRGIGVIVRRRGAAQRL